MANQWEGFLPKRSIVMASQKAQKVGRTFPCQHSDPVRLLLLGEKIQSEQMDAIEQLLGKMVQAMGLAKSETRTALLPRASEWASQAREVLDQTQPEYIVALGDYATQALLGSSHSREELRGKFQACHGAQLLSTLHPQFLLQNPDSKREAWNDLQMVVKALGTTAKKGS